jgi:hypothetical protein
VAPYLFVPETIATLRRHSKSHCPLAIWAMLQKHIVQSGGGQCHEQGVLNIVGRHAGCELPGDDVTRKVIQHRGEVIPTPTLDLEVGEVCLPQLMHLFGGMLEMVCNRKYSETRAFHQIKALQDPVGAGFRDEIALLVCEQPGDLPWRAVWMLQGQLHRLLSCFSLNAVLDLARVRAVVHQAFIAIFQILLVPATKEL